MGPISPLNLGSAGPAAGLAPALDRSRIVGQQNAAAIGARDVSSPVSGSSSAIMNLHSAVSQLLQSIGGGLEDDKILRMLIALIILMALLENSQGNAPSTSNALRGVGDGSNSQAQAFGLFSSSTTVAIHHTSTTITVASADSISAFWGTEQPQTRGGEIDLSA